MEHSFLSKVSAVTLTLAVANTSPLQAQTVQQKASPSDLVDAMRSAFGDHHSRAVHAKGVILEGEFTPSAHANNLTTAFHLQKQKSKVVVRFSDFTGVPDIPDNAGAANPRGMAIKFKMPEGSSTDIVSHSFNGFPTANSDQFRELLLAIGASGPGAAKPTALDTFLDLHPIAKTFLTTQKLPASYAAISYFGVNSFKFTNKQGQSHFIRYQFIPEEGEELLTQDQFIHKDANYLVREIGERVAKHPVKFKMYAQVSESADAPENPSIAWPDEREKVFLGVLQIERMADNSVQADKALSFNPNNVPAGIEIADPMLNLRSKAYPISVKGGQ